MAGPTAKGNQAVAGTQEVEGIGAVVGGRPPHWQTTQGNLQGGRLPHPVLSDPGGGSPLKTSPPTTTGRQSPEAASSQLQPWAEEPKDLEHPSELDPLVQEFLSGTGSPRGEEDKPDQPLTPEPSLDSHCEWVRWHAHWVETLAWWPELQKLLTQRNIIEFAKQVWASFQLPKVKYLTLGLNNDHMPPPIPHCIEYDAYLPFGNGNFASQDYQMKQPQKIPAYAKALQFWAEKAQPPQAGQPHHLAACVKELREAMGPLMLFTDEDVFAKKPSHWVKVTSSQPSKLAELEETMQDWSCSRWKTAHPQGSLSVIHSVGCSKLAIPAMVNTLTLPSQRTGTLTVPSQQVKTPLGSPVTPKQRPPPSFAEIVRSLWGDDTPHITIDLWPEMTTSPGLLAGTTMATMTSMQMWQDAVTGTTYVDTVMASMSLVSLGSTPMAVDHPVPALEIFWTLTRCGPPLGSIVVMFIVYFTEFHLAYTLFCA